MELDICKSRIETRRKVPCKIRFVSFEPLLGAVGKLDLDGISWAIVAGESGPKHRPVEAEWIRAIRKQCKQQEVAFFFKQWGGVRPKSGGRILDGREWSEYPTSLKRNIAVFATNTRSRAS